jgi:hypothetical protein
MATPLFRRWKGLLRALVMPYSTIECMQIFIDYVASNHSDRHILMLLDQASFHTSDKLILPDNMTFFPILAHSPELNPVEVLWLYIRTHYFKNDWFDAIKDVSERLLFAFSELLHFPDVIKSIAGWKWILDAFILD